MASVSDVMMGGLKASALMSMTSTLWACLLVILPVLTGFYWQFGLVTVSGTKYQALLKRICLAYAYDEEGKPDSGLIAGKWFFGWISRESGNGRQGGNAKSMRLFIHRGKLKKLLDNEPKKSPVKKATPVTLYTRQGGRGWLSYVSTTYRAPKYVATSEQERAITAMMEKYHEVEFGEARNYCISLFTGAPGCGKSSIATILATRLAEQFGEASFVDSFNPTEPGDAFSSLYSTIEPTEEKPMVVILEEVDGVVAKLREGFPPDKNFIADIRGKSSWNCFFDNFRKGKYRNVFLIMTSNKSEGWFNDEDPSYIRDGRVDIRMEIRKA